MTTSLPHSISSLCHFDKLETVLQTLTDQVADQHIAIEQQNENLNAKVGCSEYAEFLRAFTAFRDKLSRQLSYHRCQEDEPSLGEQVKQHSDQLTSVRTRLDGCARFDDLHQICEEFQLHMQTLTCRVDQDTASKREFNETAQLVDTAVAQLKALEQRVATKLDRIELSQLRTVVERIESFGERTQHFETKLRELKQQRDQDERMILDQGKRLESLEAKFQLLTGDLNKAARSKDVDDIAEKVATLGQGKADNAAHDALCSKQRALESKVDSLAEHLDQLLESTHQIQGMSSAILGNKADAEDVARKVDRDDFSHELSKLVEELHLKADRDDQSTSQLQLQELEQKYLLLEKNMAVATRFIEWFSKRGEAYEVNSNLLERQLNRLATDSRKGHQLREPYTQRNRHSAVDP